ncbi:MAG TPA: TRAP transporter small permease subunit [Xanthobacteraceae bacterium]|nr:TRAP transporter small permease subunit [Xanthobacteraceae bacterium]HWW49300.1 TRAP transporter small permease subunit [Xanthobacteraceae bacterium]
MNLFAGITRFARLVATIGLAALVLLSIFMMIDIAGRELFKTPLPGFSDLSDLIIIIAAAACFPASLANKQHVAVRFVGMAHWRLREVLDLLGHVIMLAVIVLICQQIWVYTADVWDKGQTTWLLYIPVWPVWVVTTALFVLCIPVQLSLVIKAARRVLSPVTLADEDEINEVRVNQTGGGE